MQMSGHLRVSGVGGGIALRNQNVFTLILFTRVWTYVLAYG